MSDVLIIGAGPAGSLAAALLVQQGISVLVLEKQSFPRFSVGESLLAQSVDLIDKAGMLPAVQMAGYQYKNGAAFRRGTLRSDYNFADKSTPGPGYTFQVPRSDFDHLLIREAERMGAEVRFQVEITSADMSGERPRITTTDRHGEVEEHRPRFVLDASGFGRTLPKLLNLETPSAFPMRAALFTQVFDGIPSGAFDRQKIHVTIHPQRHDVWFWLIPFSNGKASIGVVAEDAFIQRYQGTNDERLWAIVNEDPGLKDLLKSARPAIPVGELRGYAANVRQMSGHGFALLGNAAEFLDPVFSSGVTIAMKSAHLATAVLIRQLRGEVVNWTKEFEEPLRVGVDTFRNFVESWYQGGLQDIFFHQQQDPRIRQYICSILAGYAWDTNNPYVGKSGHRLRTLAAHCRDSSAAQTSGRSEPAFAV